jgi:Na+-transporting methylmalonyl-CoA/oxaloacetate decarboxylase gamma subunit
MSTDMELGIQLMIYGLAGVFLVLAVFVVTIVLLRKFFPHRDDKDDG